MLENKLFLLLGGSMCVSNASSFCEKAILRLSTYSFPLFGK